MVRHHIKKKKSDIKANASKKLEEEKKKQEELENLDRFAGSSDEEEDSDSDGGEDHDGGDDDVSEDHELAKADDGEDSGSEESEDDYEDVYAEKIKDGEGGRDTGQEVKHPKKPHVDSEDEGSSENDYKEDDQSEDEDEDDAVGPSPRDEKSLGMANAMSRILGGQMFQHPASAVTDAPTASKVAKPVILSKTTTPLQRLQHKIKAEEQALRQKRQNRRADNLSAMRLPLAPTAGMSAEKLQKQQKKNSKRKRAAKDGAGDFDENALAMASEIEGERTHRRIATRGVVALFNAISTHRATVVAEAAAKDEEKRRVREEGGRLKKRADEDGGLSTKTKHGFLDMIKKSAVAGSAGGAQAARKESGTGTVCTKGSEGNSKGGKGAVGWNALKDDFMMNSKLKDWDKEISDDDDDG